MWAAKRLKTCSYTLTPGRCAGADIHRANSRDVTSKHLCSYILLVQHVVAKQNSRADLVSSQTVELVQNPGSDHLQATSAIVQTIYYSLLQS
jgi:hypothetical protein